MRILAAAVVAAFLAGGTPMTVSIRGLPAGATVGIVVNGRAIGVFQSTATASAGDATFALDTLRSGANAVGVDVYVGECAAKTIKVWLLEQDHPAPTECPSRKLGHVVWGKTSHIAIRYPNRMTTGQSSTTKKAVLAGAAGSGAALAIGAAANTHSSESATPPGGGTPSNFAGRYTGSGSATVNTCGLAAATVVSGELTVTDAANGLISWTKTHTTAGATFTFTNVHLAVASAAEASFNASTSVNVFGNNYGVTDNAAINNGTVTLTQLFTRADGGCSTQYRMILKLS